MSDKGIDTQAGVNFITSLPEGETFVGLLEHKGSIIVCSNCSLYILVDGNLERQKIYMMEEDNA